MNNTDNVSIAKKPIYLFTLYKKLLWRIPGKQLARVLALYEAQFVEDGRFTKGSEPELSADEAVEKALSEADSGYAVTILRIIAAAAMCVFYLVYCVSPYGGKLSLVGNIILSIIVGAVLTVVTSEWAASTCGVNIERSRPAQAAGSLCYILPMALYIAAIYIIQQGLNDKSALTIGRLCIFIMIFTSSAWLYSVFILGKVTAGDGMRHFLLAGVMSGCNMSLNFISNMDFHISTDGYETGLAFVMAAQLMTSVILAMFWSRIVSSNKKRTKSIRS